jgi:hypothetical protein
MVAEADTNKCRFVEELAGTAAHAADELCGGHGH